MFWPLLWAVVSQYIKLNTNMCTAKYYLRARKFTQTTLSCLDIVAVQDNR
jgi:hypothetical protein